MATLCFVGIDIAKLTFDVCIHGSKSTRQFENSPQGYRQLLTWLKPHARQHIHVAMEATGRYHLGLASLFVAEGLKVYTLNPKRLKRYSQSQSRRSKTDSADASLLATYVCKHHELLHLYRPPSAQLAKLRLLVRRRHQLKEHRKQELTRSKELESTHAPCLKSTKRFAAFLSKELKRIDKEIQEAVKEDEDFARDYKLLMSIPQVGDVLATTFLTEVDPQNFNWGKDITAWLGLAPLEYSSGSSVYRPGRIGKGNTRLRQALYMASIGAFSNDTWKPWLEPQQARGKEGNKLVVALMDKLLRVCWGVLKHQQPFCHKTAFGA